MIIFWYYFYIRMENRYKEDEKEVSWRQRKYNKCYGFVQISSVQELL